MPDTSTVDGDEDQQTVGHKSYRCGTHDNPFFKNMSIHFFKSFRGCKIKYSQGKNVLLKKYKIKMTD